MRTVKKIIVPLVLVSSFLLTGCNNAMENMLDKGESVSENKKDPVEINKEELYNFSDEQKEALAKAKSITAKDAIDASKDGLEKVKLLDSSKVPESKDKFTDSTEFALYISNLFYKYHTSAIDGHSFYAALKPHILEEFAEVFPQDEKERNEFLTRYQQEYMDDSNKIVSLEVSEVKSIQLDVERYFYRKYTFENGEVLYYITNIKLDDDTGAWKIINDDFSPGYSLKQ